MYFNYLYFNYFTTLLVSSLFLSVTLRGRSALRVRGTYFEQLLCRFWVDFDAVFSVFRNSLPFQMD